MVWFICASGGEWCGKDLSIDQFVAASSTALGLALLMLFLFIRGDIVPGRLTESLRLTVERLAAAIESRNKLDEARLSWEKEQFVHRERRAGDSG